MPDLFMFKGRNHETDSNSTRRFPHGRNEIYVDLPDGFQR